MATIRRLSDEDVRAVFESVHNNHKPPPHLQYRVVPVGSDGLKLSPPSYEFEDGLYILLKPEQKKKKQTSQNGPLKPDLSKVPSQLVDLVLKETPPASCPWSLSGPQFPQPTAIQQRYCYPKGNPEYSSRKGGALWTMYGPDGKENIDYRLLHVYFSAKRAVNKGVSVPLSAASTPSRPAKRSKKAKTPPPPPPPTHVLKTPERPRLLPPGNCQILSHSPVLSFDLMEDPGCLSPMVMPAYMRNASSLSKFVTPPPAGVFEHRFHPVYNQGAVEMPSPFRPRILDHVPPRISENKDDESRHVPSKPSDDDTEQHKDHDSDTHTLVDPFLWEENDETIQQLEEACWNDPLFTPPLPLEAKEREEERIHAFAVRLKGIHESLKDHILMAGEAEQGPLLSLLSSWARHVAQAPLSDPKQVMQV